MRSRSKLELECLIFLKSRRSWINLKKKIKSSREHIFRLFKIKISNLFEEKIRLISVRTNTSKMHFSPLFYSLPKVIFSDFYWMNSSDKLAQVYLRLYQKENDLFLMKTSKEWFENINREKGFIKLTGIFFFSIAKFQGSSHMTKILF